MFPQAIVQACVIHLIRATLRYASRKYWDHLAKDLRAIYTAPSVDAAWAAFEELEEKWGKPYPAIPKLWRAAGMEEVIFHIGPPDAGGVLLALHERGDDGLLEQLDTRQVVRLLDEVRDGVRHPA